MEDKIVKIILSGYRPNVRTSGLVKFGVTPGGGGNIPGGLTGVVADIVKSDQSKSSGQTQVYNENIHVFAPKNNRYPRGAGHCAYKMMKRRDFRTEYGIHDTYQASPWID